jgi:hypothetical protein
MSRPCSVIFLLDAQAAAWKVEPLDAEGNELRPPQRRVAGEKHQRSPPLPHRVGEALDLGGREDPRLTEFGGRWNAGRSPRRWPSEREPDRDQPCPRWRRGGSQRSFGTKCDRGSGALDMLASRTVGGTGIRCSAGGRRRREMGVTNRGMDNPDETRTFDHGQVEVVKIGGATVGRYTFEPGWRWSESVKPIAKTDSCQAHHVGYVLTGRLHVLSDDGGEAEIGPGEAYEIEPGHDGWVVGDEAVTSVEFSGAESYAKRG